MVEFEDPERGDHAHVGAPVLEPGAERGDEVLDEIGDAERAEAAEGESADHGVLVAAILLEEVDGEEGEVGVAAGVVADVEVAHLLEDDVGGGGAHHHLAERGGDVDPHGHVGDHALEEVALGVVGARGAAPRELPELELEIGHLALPAIEKEKGVRGRGGERRRLGFWRGERKEKVNEIYPEG